MFLFVCFEILVGGSRGVDTRTFNFLSAENSTSIRHAAVHDVLMKGLEGDGGGARKS